MDTQQQTPPAAAPRPAWGDWCGFSPLANPTTELGVSAAGYALLGDPVAYVVTGTELLGGAVLPGHPAPLGIFDDAFADQLIGVVAGCYATGARDASVDWTACDWSGWDWAAIPRARDGMKALRALPDWRAEAGGG